MVESRVPNLPSIAPTLVERLGCSFSSPTIVRAFAEVLCKWESEEDERRRLDIILALTNLEGAFR